MKDKLKTIHICFVLLLLLSQLHYAALACLRFAMQTRQALNMQNPSTSASPDVGVSLHHHTQNPRIRILNSKDNDNNNSLSSCEEIRTIVSFTEGDDDPLSFPCVCLCVDPINAVFMHACMCMR